MGRPKNEVFVRKYDEREMKNAVTRGYQRGYTAAVRRQWHPNKPPLPPHEIVRAMFEAARKLRDAADNAIAAGGPDEVLEAEFGPWIDAIDAASEAVTKWLISAETEETK